MKILDREPTNEKALFHTAYCYRECGRLKDAVYCLSKVSSIYTYIHILSLFHSLLLLVIITVLVLKSYLWLLLFNIIDNMYLE